METRQPPIFEAMGGMETCQAISERFHQRAAEDQLLARIFPRDLSKPAERFAWFLADFLGGPARYSLERGKTSLACRHAPFPIGDREAAAWLLAMTTTLEELELAEEHRTELEGFFRHIAPKLSDPLLPYYPLGLEELTHALMAEADLVTRMGSRGTLLADAAGRWDVERVRLLLGLGADVDAHDRSGHTALYRACNSIGTDEKAAVATVKTLIAAGAAVSEPTGVCRTTPLHMAARRGHCQIIRVLLEAGADVGAKDSRGDTPYQRALNCRKLAAAELLYMAAT